MAKDYEAISKLADQIQKKGYDRRSAIILADEALYPKWWEIDNLVETVVTGAAYVVAAPFAALGALAGDDE